MPILGRILRIRGVVTEQQLEEAIQHQVLYGGRLGTSLVELGFVTEERLTEALSKVHGVQSAAVDLRQIQPESVTLLPKAMAAKHKVFPYRVKGRTLFLLMVDPGDHYAVAQVGFSLGYIVKPYVVPEFRMIQLLRDYYGIDERWRYSDTHRPERPAAAPVAPLEPNEAAIKIDTAVSRDEVVDAFLGLCNRFFRRVIFFIVKEPWILGWSGQGEGMDRGFAESLRIPTDKPSVFQTVARDKTFFIGRFGPEEENQRFLRSISKRPATNAAVFPIVVKTRVVNLVYGDTGPNGNVKANMGELMILAQKVPRAYLRIIRRRITDTRKAIAEVTTQEKERMKE